MGDKELILMMNVYNAELKDLVARLRRIEGVVYAMAKLVYESCEDGVGDESGGICSAPEAD